jgi:hypothetical protein
VDDRRAQADPLIPVLDAAQREGNPVPGADPQRWPQIVAAARRRWNSFGHRHPAPAADTRGARVEDLARGLLARCATGGRTMIEISDCRALAKSLARVLAPAPHTAHDGPGLPRGPR